ncbi:aspartate ammonia-lyase [Escherichia coli]|nr:aspartate ammonia-lyase [Escherichia coli]
MTLGQEFRAFSILLKEEVKNNQRTAELLLAVTRGAKQNGTGVTQPKEEPPRDIENMAQVHGLTYHRL